MSHETQQTIGAWQVETFGRLPTPAVGFIRAESEMDELADAITHRKNGDNTEIGRELADVSIVLMGMAEQFGIDLQAAIDEKMRVNRARRWIVTSDGTGQHVKEAE